MLGHVYVVEDAKDLAQIVRDVTRYGGAYRPEVCSSKKIHFFSSSIIIFNNPFLSRMCMNSFKGDLIGKRLKKQLIKRCIV
jgi:hypothetical protein